MTKCEECKGEGEYFMLPRGNPFAMRLPQLAQALRKVRCWQCHGEGYVRDSGLNTGSGPYPEGIPNE